MLMQPLVFWPICSMPRIKIRLEPYRQEIEHQINSGSTQTQIRNWLVTKGVCISKNAFSRRITSWNISRRTHTSPHSPALISAIEAAFHTTQHDDQTIAQHISSQGILTTQNQVKEIRLAQGWRRRANDDDQLSEQRAETFRLIKEALRQGECCCYGRGLLKTYLRIKFRHDARDDDVRDALSQLDKRGTESRRPGPKKTHMGGEFITPGPDWLWCCDGHDKFRNYGIEIYAGVDAFSRRIQWCYVGNSNRRAVSILCQVVTTIKAYGRCPSFFRSDRGKEVLLLADAHYSFYVLDQKAKETCPENPDDLRLRDCYMFGTSTANIRIESTWMRMIRSQTKPWLEYFAYLQMHGLYESDALEDRIVFLFVFVPILRSEISTYVETWNAHRIRHQKQRANHVAGIPNELYSDQFLPRFGWTPNSEFLSQLTEAVKHVDETYIWCEESLRALDHPEIPAASEFLPHVRHFLVPTWYRQFRIRARHHIESREQPILSLAPKPDTSKEWQVRQQIIAEMRNEADTFGLVEGGEVLGQELDVESRSETSDEDWDY